MQPKQCYKLLFSDLKRILSHFQEFFLVNISSSASGEADCKVVDDSEGESRAAKQML